jgi:serpin B
MMAGFQTWVRGLLSAKEVNHEPVLTDTSPWPERSGSFAEDNNDFAITLYKQFLQKPGNLFFSPFSVRTALCLIYAGVRGKTAMQMSRALRFTIDETMHVAMAETIHRLSSIGYRNYVTVANSLWSQKGAAVQSGFLNLVTKHYGGGMNVVDFRRDAETVRLTINRWVEDKTKHKIRELIPAGGLNSDTRLVVANAIYFKGIWSTQFRKATTCYEHFYLEGRRAVITPLMQQQKKIRYLEAGDFQMVELYYRGGNLSMLVLLPDRRYGLRNLEKALSTHMLHNCVAKMHVSEVKLFLPKFRLTWESEMGVHLRELGMQLAFIKFKADFSGINGLKPQHKDSLFISDIFHKAFIEVNEKRTVAAAASGVTMIELGAPNKQSRIPIFRADHPFLFAIRDCKSGAILFFGRMADPTLES